MTPRHANHSRRNPARRVRQIDAIAAASAGAAAGFWIARYVALNVTDLGFVALAAYGLARAYDDARRFVAAGRRRVAAYEAAAARARIAEVRRRQTQTALTVVAIEHARRFRRDPSPRPVAVLPVAAGAAEAQRGYLVDSGGHVDVVLDGRHRRYPVR